MAFVCFLNAEVVVSQLWTKIEKTANIKCKKLPFYNNVYGPSLSDTYKTGNINFITLWADDIIRTAHYIHAPWCDEINFCCFICVTQWWALHGSFFTFCICCFSISIHSWGTTTSAFRKQTNAIWKFYIRFRCWTFYRHLHVILQGRSKFCLN